MTGTFWQPQHAENQQMRPLRTIKELTSTIIKLIDHLNNTVMIVRKAMNLHDNHDNMKAIKKVFLYKLGTCNISCHDKLNFEEAWQLFWQNIS